MDWPEGIAARPIEKGDAEAWAELLAAREKVDQEGENYNADDLLEELDDPHLDAANDTLGLWADGRMVGFAKAQSSPTVVDVDRVRTEGTIHPEWRRRGLGTTLMHWLIQRAGEMHAAKHPDVPGVVSGGSITTNVGAHHMLRKLGFEESRYFFDMKRPLDQPVPEAALPEGFRLQLFDPSLDEATRVSHNEAFQDHWGSTPRDRESWKAWFTGARAFRSNVSYVVLDGETIAAYVLGYEWEADTEVTGFRDLYIGQVGTRRAYRGRGLARAALAKVLAEGARDGFQRASLGVDADNPTGALGLYESLGFTQHSKWITYSLPL
ncbi:GNAT family N-acetyltransferase [Kribbella sp. NPDC051952]|uniref:GNAT family N-acetyltransferase n=1 Tax=Kribbella sp. NPDC051952 TaxID=3154851 RepID=UPI00342BF1A1